MWFVIIGFIIGIFIISFVKSPKGKGIIGEYRINKIIKKIALECGGIELHDLMFEDEKSSSQIDHILLTQKALYVIETKNYNGYIFGNESSQEWTMTVKHVNNYRSKSGKKYQRTNISKHRFYNPIKQNQTHIRKIQNLTSINIPIYNIVVFGRKAIIKDVEHSSNNYVVHENELKKTIYHLDETLNLDISLDVQIDTLDQLIYNNITDRKLKKLHVKRIKEKYK